MPSTVALHYIAGISIKINKNIVPYSHLSALLVPIIKDKCGKRNSSDNYQPIALAHNYMKGLGEDYTEQTGEVFQYL